MGDELLRQGVSGGTSERNKPLKQGCRLDQKRPVSVILGGMTDINIREMRVEYMAAKYKASRNVGVR